MENKNSLVQKKEKAVFSTFLTSDGMKSKISQILRGKQGDNFISSLISAVSLNPSLQECEHMSIFSAGLQGAVLNLSPSPQLGHFYLVPYNDNKRGRIVAQFQIGYKGYIQLAIRSGQYEDIDVIEIKEGEYKGRDKHTGKPVVEFIEDDAQRDALQTVGYFAYFRLLNGFTKSVYWTKEKMESHAITYSKGYKAKKGYTFWEKDFNAMAFKTLLRHIISKWGIMSLEMQSAYEKDQSVVNEQGMPDYVDNDDTQSPKEIEQPKQETISEPQTTEEEVEIPFGN
jgi:recombinase, phage RecT family